MKNNAKADLFQLAYSAYTKLTQVLAFASPEIIALGEKLVFGFVNQSDFLTDYKFYFESLFRSQKHILDVKSEGLLANFASMGTIGSDLHASLSIIDRTDEVITLSDKTKVAVTQANYRMLIENSKEPNDRKKIIKAMFKRFVENKSAFATTYNLVLKQLEANYKSRGFNSALEAKLFTNNIPVSVFTNLKDIADKNTAPLKKDFKLRKQALGLKRHYFYDRLLPIVKLDKKYPYEDALKMFYASIKDLDQEFIAKQHDAMKDGFVDVLPKDGKETGAYSSSVHDFHPFILLNHTETLDDVFTLAHEAGHSAHSLFSSENQAPINSNYSIFVAEIASTFNELILLDYLLANATSKEEKISLLVKEIDNICGTFYRQTLFATYEFEVNKLVQDGHSINDEVLSGIFTKLYKHYYGIDTAKEYGLAYEWAYIPHLYNSPFYVYQYATSFAASLKIYENVKNQVPNAFDSFKNLLKSGGSAYPVDQAKAAGADLTKKETIMAVINRFNDLLTLLEKELEN
jgi:oligoendopeptidase F